MTDMNPGAQGASPVEDLIRQREQLRGWLSKLGEVAPGAPSRVADRVRKDYEDRLRRVNEELAGFREDIDRDLARLREDLDSAEQRRAHASEVLEEARLRHMIGELDDGEWGRQEERLQAEADAAAAEVEQAQGEVERLAALATDVNGAGEPAAAPEAPVAHEPEPEQPEPATEAEPAWEPETSPPAPEPAPAVSGPMFPEVEEPAAPAAEEEDDADVSSWLEQLSAATSETNEPESDDGGDLPWLEKTEEHPRPWTPDKDESAGLEFLDGLDRPAAEPTSESLADDDLAFLEELDRAISGSPGSQRTPPAPAAPTPPAAAPAAEKQSGGPLLCKECGAINEPHSWYCEVCGSEL